MLAPFVSGLRVDWEYLCGPLLPLQIMEACITSGALRLGDDASETGLPQPKANPLGPLRDLRLTSLQIQDAVSNASRTSSGFGGPQFWAALCSSGLEQEVQHLFPLSCMVQDASAVVSGTLWCTRTPLSPADASVICMQVRSMFFDARMTYRRKGALALLVEQDLKLARFLAGLHGHKARREVSEIVTFMVENGTLLPLPEDRLLTVIEAAQVPASSVCAIQAIMQQTTSRMRVEISQALPCTCR